MFDVFHLNVNIMGANEEAAVTILTAMAIHTLWSNREKGGVSAVSLSAEAAVLSKVLMNTKFVPQAKIILNITSGV